MASQTQSDPKKPGYWIDARQPLPKPGEYKPQPKPEVASGAESPAQLAARIARKVGLRELEPFIRHCLELEQRVAALESRVSGVDAGMF